MAGEADTIAAFTNSMQTALQEQAVLRSALLPMAVTAEVCLSFQVSFAMVMNIRSWCATT